MLKNKGFHHSAFLSPCPQWPRPENGLGLPSTSVGASGYIEHGKQHAKTQSPRRTPVPSSHSSGCPAPQGVAQARPGRQAAGAACVLTAMTHKTHSRIPGGLHTAVSLALVNPTAVTAQLPHTRYLPETTSQPKPLCNAGAVSPLPRSGCQASESSHDPETA